MLKVPFLKKGFYYLESTLNKGSTTKILCLGACGSSFSPTLSLKKNLYWLSAEAANGGVLKKGVLRNFAKITGKPLCQSLFFNKVEFRTTKIRSKVKQMNFVHENLYNS